MMEVRDPSYIGVRTAGTLGDQGADGLTLHGRRLYACYAPETFEDHRLTSKFNSDLLKGLTKRRSEFETFVFVHNDLRGMHPKVASSLVAARDAHSDLRFEQIGYNRFSSLMMGLEKADVEDLLGTPLAVQDMVFSPIDSEIAELLELLTKARLAPDTFEPLNVVPEDKMDYNQLQGDVRRELLEGMKYQPTIAEYYANSRNPTEQDEVALGFKDEYLTIKRQGEADPEQIMFELESYILGNGHVVASKRRAASSILAYFFSLCEIFEEPTVDWMSSRRAGG